VSQGGRIELGPPGGPGLNCSGGTPLTTNTDAISVHNAPGMTDNLVVIFEAAAYAPGLSPEPGDDEIEIFVNLNNGERTELVVVTSLGPGRLVFGTNGINPNAADNEDQPDRDIDHNDTVASLAAQASGGGHVISARGGSGTGGPLTRAITLFGGEGSGTLVEGGDGPDALFGGGGADELAGFAGDDLIDGGEGANVFLSGGDGNDTIRPGSATDPVDGGPGDDLLSYLNVESGVSAGLEGTGAERLNGTVFADVLVGDDGPNTILGFAGDDALDGRGGADQLEAGVGDDSLQIRDSEADTADCGANLDTVTADQVGIDTLTGCESVIFPPPPDPGAPGGGGGGGQAAAFGARTLVTLKLTRNRVPARGPLAVRVSNANAFAVGGTLSGVKLRTKSFAVLANASKTVRLKLPKALRRKLARKRRLSLRMTAKVRDPAGNTRTVRKTLRPRLPASTSNARSAR
jgi:Ca2+-binding RTX toxin-like protein